MAKYIYNKNRKVKIFKIVTSRNEQGFEIATKKYIHPLDKCLSAYFKDLRSSEQAFNRQAEDLTEVVFVLNRRVLEKDMYIEYISRRTYGTTTYQITSIDNFDDTSYDVKVGARKVNPPTYDNVEGTEWQSYN